MFGNENTDNQSATNTTSTATAPVLGLDGASSSAPMAPSISSDGTITPAQTSTAPAVTPAQETPLFGSPSPSLAPAAPSSDSPKVPDDLLTLKKDALSKLVPLVDKLDQSPSEKFKTTMMLIQASDDKTLIPKAYDAANAIEDEKVKAQALLDIINEINYFTNQSTTD